MSRATPKAFESPGSADLTGHYERFSPLRFLVITVGGIFLAEVIAMIFLLVFNLKILPYYLQTLIDAGIMIVLISPIIYYFSLSPLLLHIERRKQVETQLHEMALFPALNPDAVLQVNALGEIKKTNSSAEKMGLFVGGQLSILIPDLRDLDLADCIATGSKRQIQQTQLGDRVLQWVIHGAPELELAFLYSTDVTEWKRAEEEIYRLSSIVQQTADTVVVTNRDGVIEYVNPAFEQKTGYGKDEVLGKNPRILKSGLHDEKFYQELWGTILKSEVFHGELTNRNKNGGLLHEVKTITPLRDLQGNITHFVATGKDITERREAEEQLRRAHDDLERRVQERTEELVAANAALLDEINERKKIQSALEQSERELRESEEKAQNLVKYAPAAIYEMDIFGRRLLSVNDIACQWSGYSREEMLSMNPMDLMDAEGKVKFQERIHEKISEKDINDSAEYRIITKEGHEIVAEMHVGAFTYKEGVLENVLVVAHDITARKQAEDELRQNREDLFRAQQVGQIGSWRLDVRNNTLAWSKENHRIFGIPQGTPLTYETFLGTIHPGDREYVDTKWKAGIAGEPYDIEHRVVVNGDVKWVREKAYLEVDDAGNLLGGFGITQDITERKRAEEQLLYQSTLLANVNDAIIASDAQYRITAWNSAAETLYGWKSEEVVGRIDVDIIRTEWSEKDANEMRRVIEERGRWRGEATQIHKDGTRFPVEVSSIVLYDDRGQVTGYVSVNRDSTERKRVEEQLERSNQKLNEILASIQDDFYVLDRDWDFVYASKLFTSKVGKEPHDIVGQNIWKMFPKYMGTILEENFRAAMEKREVRRFELGGKYTSVWYRMTAFPSAEGITVLGTDITERKRADEALRRSEEQFYKVFHFNPVGVNLFRLTDSRSVDVNDAFLDLTGYSREEFVGHSGLELNLFPNSQERVKWMQGLLEYGAVRNIDTQIRKKSGQIADVLFSIVQIEINHEMMGLVMVIDITDRRLAEEALRRAHDELELRVRERTKELAAANKELSDEIAERKEVERQLRVETTALESAANGVIITDIAGAILWSNPAFLSMSGYNMDEVIGATPHILFSGRQEKIYYQNLWHTILEGNIWRGETINRRKDGSLYVEEQTITPVRGEDCRISHFIAIKQDVTERKRIEAEIQERNQREKNLTQMIHTMQVDIARDLHDTIGQNIGYLRMKLDYMAEKDLSAKGSNLKAEFSQMSQVANESYDLVRGTLAILQSQGPDDLLQLFKRYAGQIVERSALEVEFFSRGAVGLLSTHQMRQFFYIFREALSNIEKHSCAAHASVDMSWGANAVELSIRDNGKGFDPSLVAVSTGHYGLKFMRERTEMMSGSFQVKTELGVGTQVIITVPISRNGFEN